VFSWFDGRAKRVEMIPRLTARGDRPSTTKVDIRDLTPELLPFLGQSAYVELGVFESLARAVAIAPNLAAKQELSIAAGRALSKHQGLVAEIRRRGAEPADVMAPFVPALDAFRAEITGADWTELLLSCYLVGGLLDDFFIRLSDGLPGEVGPRIAHLLGEDAGTVILATQIAAAIAADAPLASHLALWGRRLVGDTLLIARSALAFAGTPNPTGRVSAAGAAEARIEPVFTDLIAAHTRRMDGLGLTA
jgi:hypothetical protein